jgi:copper chaperone
MWLDLPIIGTLIFRVSLSQKEPFRMLKFKVEGMTCGHCVKAVTQAVQNVAPQAQVEVSLETGVVGITGATNSDAVIAAIAAEGYAIERLAA